MKSEVLKQRLIRSMRSVGVRGVREERVVSSMWRRRMTSIHFFKGIEGKRASASNDTRISSGSSFTSLIFFMNSKEFLHTKGHLS